MEENQTGLTGEKRADNDNRKAPVEEATPNAAARPAKPATLRQRWNSVQIGKATILWICLGMIAGTMLVGFTLGGWQTGKAAAETATTTANDAVVQRLASICVANFQQDPANVERLEELKAGSSYAQRDYVVEQGWATMPGDEQADSKVAAACARWLTQLE